MATKGPSGNVRTYVESDISAASNSRKRAIRKKVSSTGSGRKLMSRPRAGVVPSQSPCMRSYGWQARGKRRALIDESGAGVDEDADALDFDLDLVARAQEPPLRVPDAGGCTGGDDV